MYSPGMKESKSFFLYALLIALAKNPPNGATKEAKSPYANPCSCIGNMAIFPNIGTVTSAIRKTALGSQTRGGGNGQKNNPSAGQVNHVKRDSKTGK